jgi:hypothetical protein
VRLGLGTRPLNSGVRGLITMPHLQLDSRSLLSLRAFRALRISVTAVVILYTVATWFFGAPRVSGLVVLSVIVGWYACLTILAKRIRCPYCNESAVASYAPSWRKVPPFRMSGSIQCAHCHEIIDSSGGTSPPSNISLQADRER